MVRLGFDGSTIAIDGKEGGGGISLAQWEAMRRGLKRKFKRDRLSSMVDKSGRLPV